MSTLRVNPQDKMHHAYVDNLEKMVESLCQIINALLSSGTHLYQQHQILSNAYQTVKQILAQIKYYDKFNNNPSPVTTFIAETITLLQFQNEHQSFMETSKLQDSLPLVRGYKDTNNFKGLTIIHQKGLQESILHNYMRKQPKRKNVSQNQKPINKGYSRTINQPVTYLNSSRQYDIIREETRRSLDNSGITDKKPLYKDLERYKGNQQIFPAVKEYLDKRNMAKIKMHKNKIYTISKLI